MLNCIIFYFIKQHHRVIKWQSHFSTLKTSFVIFWKSRAAICIKREHAIVIQHRNDKSKGSIVASMLVSTVGVMGFVLILKFASLSRRLDEETEKGERRGQMMIFS
jgi:hypothetical protein